MKTPAVKILVGAAATAVVITGLVVAKVNNWLSPESTGPGSGDELTEWPGPGSGDELFDSGVEPTPNWPDGPGSGDELTEWPGPGSGDELPADWGQGPGSDDIITYEEIAIGSCNTITDASICVEYYGKYWNINTIQLACAGVGSYSSEPCPRPTMGGCRMNPDTDFDMASWHYNYGGDPFDPAVVSYAAQACNANPIGIWITTNQPD